MCHTDPPLQPQVPQFLRPAILVVFASLEHPCHCPLRQFESSLHHRCMQSSLRSVLLHESMVLSSLHRRDVVGHLFGRETAASCPSSNLLRCTRILVSPLKFVWPGIV